MATRSLGTLTLDLVMKLGGFKQGAGQAEREFDKFSKNLQSKASKLTGAFKSLGGLLVGGLGIYAIVDAVQAQEQAIAQLEAVLKSTGSVAGRTSQELQTMASGLQGITTYGDEAILAMQAVLLTFTQVRGEQFDQATKAILDMSTALKSDLQSAALQVGKALNDPIQGVSTLKRAGVQLTAEQKALVESLQRTGDIAGAQTVILKELETQFGGSAEAIRNTFSGALAGLKNAIGDLLENRQGLPAVTDQINSLTEALADAKTQRSANQFVSAFLKAAGAVISAFAPLVDLFSRMIISAENLGARIDAFFGRKLDDELERRLFSVAGQMEDLQLRRERLASNIESDGFLSFIDKAELLWVEKKLEDLAVKQAELGTGRGPQNPRVARRFRDDRLGQTTQEDRDEIDKIYEQNRTALEKYNEELRKLEELRKKVGTKGEPLLDDETYQRELARLKDTLASAQKKESGSTGAKDAAKELEAAQKKVQDFIDRLNEQRATLGLTEGELLRYSITSGDVADALALMGEAAGPLREKLLALADATTADKAKADIEEQIKALQDQATQLSLTDEQAFAYSVTQGELAKQLALTGVDAERLTQALLDANNALAQARKELEQQAQRESIFEATRTDAERYAETMKDLGELFGDSATDQDTYGRAVAGAVSEYITASNAVTEYRLRIEELNRMLADGTLTQEAFESAVATVDETFAEAGREAAKAFSDQAKRNTQDILANFLEDPFSRGIDGLIQDFDAMFRKIAAQAIAAKIAEKLFDGFDDWITQAGQMLKQFFANMASSSSSSGWGSILGGIAGLFGGGATSGLSDIAITAQRIPGYAEGGFTGIGGVLEPAGVVHRGEYVVSADKVRQPGVHAFLDTLQRGSPESVMKQLRALELKVPRFSQGGLVGAAIPGAVPAASVARIEALSPNAPGQNITQQFAISAPQGTVSVATQQQIAAAAARGLAQANRRNN